MLLAFFSVAILAAGISSVMLHAEEEDARRTVKVAVLNNTTYADQDENGTWTE